MREITEAQFLALEAEHGEGNVLVVSDPDGGADDFAFRRYTEADVTQILQWEADGRADCLALGMKLALLCPDAPRAGKGPAADFKLPKEEQSAMAAERSRFDAALKVGPAQGDIFALQVARACGYGWGYDLAPSDPSLLIVKPRTGIGQSFDPETHVLGVRAFTEQEYSEYRRLSLHGGAGEDDRYAFKVAVSGGAKDELAKRYAFLPVAVGKIIPGLGASRGVSLKKFSRSSPAPRP
jgi:hypothetical protein